MIKWCFSTLGCTDRSLSEVIGIAQQYGISALEIRGLNGELNNEKINDFSPENALKTKNAFLNSGISPLILGTSVSFHDEACFDKNLSDGMRSLQIASRIGFLGIRVFGNSIVGDEKECIRRVCSGIKELCRFAEPLNISVLLEVHGDFNTLERILPIVEHCRDSKAFGLIWDVCHTNSAYSDDWKRFYDPLAPYIRHIHLKDVKGGKHVLPGEGEIPIKEIIEYLTAGGYDSYFSLEWEKHWRRELEDIEVALDKLIKMF